MLIDGGDQAGAENFGGYITGIDVGEQVVSPMYGPAASSASM
jgi:hypothetical protein